MPRNPVRLLPCLFAAALAAACQPNVSDTADSAQRPISLLDRWSAVEISDAVPPPEIPPRSELRFDTDGDGDAPASWRALGGIEDLRVEDGLLQGRSSSQAPIIAVDFDEPQGGGDELWSVELRLRTSAGTRLAAHPLLAKGPPIAAVQARTAEWPISSAITGAASEEIKKYTVVLDRVFLYAMPPAMRSIEKLLIRPTNVAGADFAIESVRLVFRKEMLASVDSGPGWHGLADVFRESLVSRAPETLAFRLELPARPWLDLAVGTIDEPLPSFHVEIVADGSIEELAELRAEKAEQWQAKRIDLEPWAGQEVEVRLRAEGEHGQLAFWGTPVIRSSVSSTEPESSTPERPQAVVVFLADTLRPDHLDAWGYDRETAPALARLAAEGVRFDHTIAQSTWTKVSVPSILTSLYPSTSGVAGQHDRISAGETTLAEAFREAGFATFATSSVPFSGQLTNLHQGVEVMHELSTARGPSDPYHSKSAKQWVDAYIQWLDLHRDVPTFALIHAMDPHNPYRPEEPFDTMWATPEDAERYQEQAAQVRPHIKSPLLQRFVAASRGELEEAGVDEESFIEHERAWYDGSIRGLDVQLERLVGHLRALDLEDRSLLAFVSDHGEEFLEHGRHWHGESVYGEVANVPMALWGTGVPEGVEVEEMVQTIDLMPTLLDLAGLDIPDRAQGRSLRPLFDQGEHGGELRPVPAFVELPSRGLGDPPSYAILDEGWKLVWYPESDEKELYRVADDPFDQHDLAAEQPDEVARLAAKLERFQTWARNQKLEDAELTGEMSAEQLEQLRSLGYIE